MRLVEFHQQPDERMVWVPRLVWSLLSRSRPRRVTGAGFVPRVPVKTKARFVSMPTRAPSWLATVVPRLS
ncbi:hypothetical protein [Dactylosporangium cerinum]